MSANPPDVTTDVLSVALVSLFGPWGALAALAYKFGSPWVMGIIKNAAEGKDPTPENWAALAAKIEISGETLIPKRPEV